MSLLTPAFTPSPFTGFLTITMTIFMTAKFRRSVALSGYTVAAD